MERRPHHNLKREGEFIELSDSDSDSDIPAIVAMEKKQSFDEFKDEEEQGATATVEVANLFQQFVSQHCQQTIQSTEKERRKATTPPPRGRRESDDASSRPTILGGGSGRSGMMTMVPYRVPSSNNCVPLPPTAVAMYTAMMAAAEKEKVKKKAMRRRANIVVLGAPQCGKSSFVNAYRAAVCAVGTTAEAVGAAFPLAPVGKCGRYGTQSVEVFYRARHYQHSTVDEADEDSWALIDTPGIDYHNFSFDNNNAFELRLLNAILNEGLPNKTALVGAKAVTEADLATCAKDRDNVATHAVIVVQCSDFVQRQQTQESKKRLWGWLRGSRNEEKLVFGNAEKAVEQLANLITFVRDAMNDTAPFVVATGVDKVAATTEESACVPVVVEAVRKALSTCVPPSRLFCLSLPPNGFLGMGDRKQLITLHQAVMCEHQFSLANSLCGKM